jgi:hypothetical protein
MAFATTHLFEHKPVAHRLGIPGRLSDRRGGHRHVLAVTPKTEDAFKLILAPSFYAENIRPAGRPLLKRPNI